MQRINHNADFRQKVADEIKNQIFIGHNEPIVIPEPTNRPTFDVRVSGLRTMESARQYVQKGKHIAVLNFASSTMPGGGVRNGASAQEESLCRVSTLLPCLASDTAYKMFYGPHRAAGNPLHNDDLIYTKGVLVIKDDDYKPLNDNELFCVDVITCAAPNLREKPSNKYNRNDGEAVKISDAELLEIHKSRARKILAAAAINHVDVVILGAFGCGAFRNPPEVVAAAYKAVIEEFRGHFDAIEFAVYCRPGDNRNFEVFHKALNIPAGR